MWRALWLFIKLFINWWDLVIIARLTAAEYQDQTCQPIKRRLKLIIHPYFTRRRVQYYISLPLLLRMSMLDTITTSIFILFRRIKYFRIQTFSQISYFIWCKKMRCDWNLEQLIIYNVTCRNEWHELCNQSLAVIIVKKLHSGKLTNLW